jgi:hypothetical protein
LITYITLADYTVGFFHFITLRHFIDITPITPIDTPLMPRQRQLRLISHLDKIGRLSHLSEKNSHTSRQNISAGFTIRHCIIYIFNNISPHEPAIARHATPASQPRRQILPRQYAPSYFRPFTSRWPAAFSRAFAIYFQPPPPPAADCPPATLIDAHASQPRRQPPRQYASVYSSSFHYQISHICISVRIIILRDNSFYLDYHSFFVTDCLS